MKTNLLNLLLIIITTIACNRETNFEDLSINMKNVPNNVKGELTLNGDYLVFNNLDCFDSILNALNSMDDLEYSQWADSIGFRSAKIIKDELVQKLYCVPDEKTKVNLISEYSDHFNISEDDEINYKFYVHSYAKVLNTNGLVKIGSSLYKFTVDKEYISIDGSMNRIEDAININASTNKEDTLLLIYNGREISSFNDESLLKSSTTILAEGIKTNSEAKRRIIYSLESAVFFSFYAYDPYTGIPWYTTGYRLYLYLIQQEYKKKLFSGYGWYDMRASFDLKDMYIHWYDLGDGNSQGYNGSLADVHYSTTSDVTHYFCSRKDYTYNPYNLDLYVRQLDVRFWSSGISEDYAVTLNYAW